MKISQYKKIALNTLKGFWSKAFTVFAIVYLVSYLISYFLNKYAVNVNYVISLDSLKNYDQAAINEFIQHLPKIYTFFGISVVLQLILVNPLSVGVNRFIYKRLLNVELGVSDIFEYFSSFKKFLKVFLLSISIAIRIFLKTLIASLPLNICGIGLIYALVYMPDLVSSLEMQALYFFCVAISIALFFVFYVRIIIRYFLVYFVMFDQEDENLKNKEIFKISKKAIKKNYGKMFLLALSFVGWFLLGVLALIIITLFLPISSIFIGAEIITGLTLIITAFGTIILQVYASMSFCVFAKEKIDIYLQRNETDEEMKIFPERIEEPQVESILEEKTNDDLNLENKDVL
jgi:uncharacterized membrane protein